jgi:hypothetical protein
LRRGRHGDFRDVVGVVGLVALVDLVVGVGNAADVVGAWRKIGGQRHGERLMIEISGLAGARQCPRVHSREHCI